MTARAVPPLALLVAGKDPELSIGGHGSYVRGHARALREAGYEPHLFSVFPRSEERHLAFGTVHRVATAVTPRWPWMLPFHAAPLARAVEAFVRRRALRRVLIHGFALWGGVTAAVARRLRRRGIEVETLVSAYGPYLGEAEGFLRGLDPEYPPAYRLRARLIHRWSRLAVEPSERRGYARARLVLVNYESVRRVLATRYGVDRSCRLVPYSPESAFLREETADGAAGSPSPRGPLIVSVSRHDGRKGVNVLLRALARLRHDGLPFRAQLVGGGPLLEADRRLAHRLGLRPGGPVTIEGFVPDPGVFLRKADLFVLPSLSETSGSLALIEALQAGLPVVASACDGIPEDVESGRSALLVTPGDTAALAAGLTRLLVDPDLRRKLSAGARETFRRRFTPERFVAALGEVYQELGFPGRRECPVHAGDPELVVR